MDEYQLHYPKVEDLYAPACRHDYACPVCWENHAVLEMNCGIFQPCWTCQEMGYKIKQSFWKKLIYG